MSTAAVGLALAISIPALVFLFVIFIIYAIAPVAWRRMSRDLNATYEPGDPIDGAMARAGLEQESLPVLTAGEDGSLNLSFSEGRSISGIGVLVTVDGKMYSGGGRAASSLFPPGSPRGVLDLVDTKHLAVKGVASTGKGFRSTWRVPGLGVPVVTTAWVHDGGPRVSFKVELPDGIRSTGATRESREMPAVAFPVFELVGPNRRVFCYKEQVFCPPMKRLHGTSTQGPVVFYDNSLDAMIIGPVDRFIHARTGMPRHGASRDDRKLGERKKPGFVPEQDAVVYHGIDGRVESLPEGFEHHALVQFSRGINDTVYSWCEKLREYHGVPPRDPLDDPVLATLGYWTDNGAYYYYRTEKGMNYHDTLLHAKKVFDEREIPFGYFQVDSWWYPKVMKEKWKKVPWRWLAPLTKGLSKGGAEAWEPIKELFPEGLSAFQEQLGLSLVAHARWWAPESKYTDDYKFEVNSFGALPLEKRFWDDIMAKTREMGIICYEQDWITTMYNNMPKLRSNIDIGENLLDWMGKAAEENGLTIQYCMAPPGVFMQALKLPAVTNARTGGDYWARAPKEFFIPDITQANILCQGVGIWPSCDVYYSKKTSVFSGQFLYREHHPEFMTIVSALCGGLVCPGDRAKHVDGELLAKTCDGGGQLYKPDRPVTPNDLMFTAHQKPYIMNTSTTRKIGGGTEATWHYIVVVSMWPKWTNDTVASLDELGIDEGGVLYDFKSGTLEPVDPGTPFKLPKKYMAWRYLVVAPWLLDGVSLVGSPSKFVCAARNLLLDLLVDGAAGEISFTVRGAPGEAIDLLFFSEHRPARVAVDVFTDAPWAHDARTKILSIKVVAGGTGTARVALQFRD